jgi:hypothetical protein
LLSGADIDFRHPDNCGTLEITAPGFEKIVVKLPDGFEPAKGRTAVRFSKKRSLLTATTFPVLACDSISQSPATGERQPPQQITLKEDDDPMTASLITSERLRELATQVAKESGQINANVTPEMGQQAGEDDYVAGVDSFAAAVKATDETLSATSAKLNAMQAQASKQQKPAQPCAKGAPTPVESKHRIEPPPPKADSPMAEAEPSAAKLKKKGGSRPKGRPKGGSGYEADSVLQPEQITPENRFEEIRDCDGGSFLQQQQQQQQEHRTAAADKEEKDAPQQQRRRQKDTEEYQRQQQRLRLEKQKAKESISSSPAPPLQLPADLDNVSKTDVQGLALLIKSEFTANTDALFLAASPEEYMESVVTSVSKRFAEGDRSGQGRRTQTPAFDAFLMRAAKAAFTITMRSFAKTEPLRGCTDRTALLKAHDLLMAAALQNTEGAGMTTTGSDSLAQGGNGAGGYGRPPPDASSLKAVPVSALVLGRVNHGVKITFTMAAHAFKYAAIMTVAADATNPATAVRIAVYNVGSSDWTPSQCRHRYPQSDTQRWMLMEPNYKTFADGSTGVRVDDPATLVPLIDQKGDATPPAATGSKPCSADPDGSSSSGAARSSGNEAFRRGDWALALSWCV